MNFSTPEEFSNFASLANKSMDESKFSPVYKFKDQENSLFDQVDHSNLDRHEEYVIPVSDPIKTRFFLRNEHV